MALAEVLTVSLGGAVVRAVVKSWIGDSDLVASATDDVSELLKQAGIDFLERRRIARDLEEATERVAERLTVFFEAEQFGGLAPNEREAAAYTVAATIERGFTDPTVAVAEDLSPDRLERRLREAHPDAAREALLEPLAVRLYDIALAESCAYLVSMVENLPRFAGSAFAELLARERAILEKLDEALEHLPRTNADEALTFETRYLREVARQLDVLRLFGFSASPEVQRYQLSVAYISLSVALDVDHEGHADNEPVDLVAEWNPDEDDLDAGADQDDAQQLLRVEEVVQRSPELLVRGIAGSGKTTLLHWLAVSAARRSFPRALDELNGTVPFFVPLRRFAEDPMPPPPDFVDSVAGPIKGLMPTGFVEETLDAGRALVLVDGVDELAPERRDEVAEWLSNLRGAYPLNRFVVTSRPPAVDERWLEKLEFAACMLEPMGLRDLDSFIDHWHDAVGLHVDDGSDDALRETADQLKSTIRRHAPLRRLATTPLLCAMLCALHYDGSAQLPRDRIQLYDRALEALLERRDADRRVSARDGLTLREKREVLRDLAYWYLRNGYSDAPKVQVVEQVARSLERIQPTVHAEVAFAGLLERTGLLREPVVERVDFVHRTFLEYLAAQAVVEQDDIGYLLTQAHDDAFAEVVVLAAGTGNASQRHALISGLLERAERQAESRKRLQLLAVACLETVTALDPDLTTQVEVVLHELVPPTTITAAKELAAAGSLAVPLLGPPAGRQALAVEARASIRALGLIGTEDSLNQLVHYRTDPRGTVVEELIRQWTNFDRIEYAQRVMADSPLFRGGLSVEGPDWLETLPFLSKLRDLTVEGAGAALNLEPLRGMAQLESLVLFAIRALYSVHELLPLPRLQRLVLDELKDLERLDGLSELRELHTLRVVRSPAISDLGPLRHHPALTRLEITGVSVLDLEPLAGLPLRWLDLGAEYLAGLDALSELRDLRDLSIADVEGELALFPLVDVDGLRSLTLKRCTGPVALAPLARAGPPLYALTIEHSPAALPGLSEIGPVNELALAVNDLAELGDLSALECGSLHIDAKTGATLPRLPPSLEELQIHARELSSLEGLPTARLRDLTLDCPQLADLAPLRDTGEQLEWLTVRSVHQSADLRPIKNVRVFPRTSRDSHHQFVRAGIRTVTSDLGPYVRRRRVHLS